MQSVKKNIIKAIRFTSHPSTLIFRLILVQQRKFFVLIFIVKTVLMFMFISIKMLMLMLIVYLTSALRTSIASARTENVHKSGEQRAHTRPARALGDIPSQ